MKKNYYFIVYLLFLSITACDEQKEIERLEQQVQAETQNNPSTFCLLDHNYANYSINEEGALVFESLEDFSFLIDSISKLTEDEFQKWEKSINFHSYRTFIDELLEKTDNPESLLQSHPNYFVMNNNYEMVLPKVSGQLTRSIINTSGFFYIGETKNIVHEEVIMDNNSSSITTRGYDPVSNIIEYPVIHSDIKNQKKIMSGFKLYKIKASSNIITTYSTICEITVRPRSFGIAGWTDQSSGCHVEEFMIHMPGLGSGGYFDHEKKLIFGMDEFMYLPTISSSKAVKLFTATIIMNHNSTSPIIQDPYCVHYRARTNQMGKDGVAYNTFHPAPGMTSCHHRTVTNYQHLEY